MTVFGALLLATVAWAGAPVPSAKAREREAVKRALLQAVENSPLKTARTSLLIRSLDDGTVLYARDENELLNPASNVKLVTSAAALSRLGTGFRYETEFFTDTDFKNGKARVLWVRGRGDPTITTERLYQIAGELQHNGLTEITGDIIVDDTFFDQNRIAPGYDQERGDKSYLAPVGALSLNWNTAVVYVRPGETVGSPAITEVEPDSGYFEVEADVRTGTRTQRRFTVTSKPHRDNVRQLIEVKGVVPVDKGAWSVSRRIDRPDLYFGLTLKQLLKQRGVKVKGRVRSGTVPPGQKMLYVAQSDTLDIVLKKLNKWSSNFVAEQLIRTLGAELKGAPGTHEKGIDVVEEFLASEVGLPRGSYVMKNGSGLNDTNRFSARQLTKLLKHMLDNFPLAPEYLSALGIAGKDGTLKYRFEGSDAEGRLRAKTGTLENVSALSGYLQAVGGERFVFSFIVNDFPGRASAVVRHIDALGAAVASQGGREAPSEAVARMTTAPSLVGTLDTLEAQMKTYQGFATRGDPRNTPFLRTAWRAEKDPAVRAVIADALIQSDPREGANVRIFLDSAVASEDVYGRLRRAAKEGQLNLPVLGPLVELASSGNTEAMGRLFEFVEASRGDDLAAAHLAEQLAVVANDAPSELVQALKAAPSPQQESAVDALVAGLVKAGQADAPLWEALRAAQGLQDAAMVEFSKELETTLSKKIARANAPEVEGATAELPPRGPVAEPAPPTAPGG